MRKDDIKEKYNRIQGRIDRLKDLIEDLQSKNKLHQEGLEDCIQARWVIQEVAKITQARLKKRIEDLVTVAIRAVFDRDLRFIFLIEQKANRIECTPIVMEGEFEQDPYTEMGGGIVDIISFALRIVLWSMEKPKSNNAFFLDEPMKNTSSGRYRERAVNMFKEISEKLTLQLIIITHIEEIADAADRAYNVIHDGKFSKVSLIGEEKIRRLK